MRLFVPIAERARKRAKLGPSVAIATPKTAPKQQRKGVALIMVLVITVILSAIAADLKNGTQVNLRAAVNSRDELQAYFHAKSAIELELFFLRFQSMLKGILGNFLPIPLFELSGMLVSSDTMKGIVDSDGPTPTDEKKKESFALDQPFGDFEGSFWIEEVVNENRKLNLNSGDFGIGSQNMLPLLLAGVFDDPKYDKLFENIGDSRDPIRNRIEIIANIIDWLDANTTVDPVSILTGDQSTSGSDESSRYDQLPYNASYKPKNGLYNSVAELRMVPGINDAFMRLFAKSFTVWGDSGKISMKTADEFMYRALIRAISATPPMPGDEEKFQKFWEEKALMTMLPGSMYTVQTFKTLLDTSGFVVDPARLQKIEKLLNFGEEYDTYRITAIGRVNNASSKITVVWRDNRAQGELYYWREE
jgi:hypothetical protein